MDLKIQASQDSPHQPISQQRSLFLFGKLDLPLSAYLTSIEQYRYLKVNNHQGETWGRPLLTLRYTKPELEGHGRSEFYIACQSIFDLRFLSPSLALMKQYWNSKVKDCPIIIWICCVFLLSIFMPLILS